MSSLVTHSWIVVLELFELLVVECLKGLLYGFYVVYCFVHYS